MKRIFSYFLSFFLLLSLSPRLAGAQALSVSDLSGLPILMYHHVSETGPYNSYTISLKKFKSDMEYLRQNGYTALLTEDLLKIESGEMPMPERPVMITFDDGYESNYTLAYPVLRETGMKAVISLIAGVIQLDDLPPNGFLTWAQCKEMSDSGYIEIGSHTFYLHNMEIKGDFRLGGPNGIERKDFEDDFMYRWRAETDLNKSIALIEQYVEKTPLFFAYPFGVRDPIYSDILKDSPIQMSVLTSDQSVYSGGLYDLSRINVTMKLALSSIPSLAPLPAPEPQVKQPAGTQGLALYRAALERELMPLSLDLS